jgi:hypothetical protein
MSYEVRLKADVVEVIDGADGYVQEGPLTTFFQGRDGRTVLDAWARRLASFRTADIVCVHWVPPSGDVGAAVRPLEGLPWAV